MAIGAEALGRRLGADRAGFLRIVDGDQIAFGIGWSDGSIPPLEGRAPLDVLGSDLRRGAIAGATLKFRDSRASARFADTTIPALGIKERKSVAEGTSGSCRVERGGHREQKNKKRYNKEKIRT